MNVIHLADGFGVFAVVAASVFWLVLRFRSPQPPACHQTAPAPAVVPAPDVLIGASLQRGLQRARARKSESRVSN